MTASANNVTVPGDTRLNDLKVNRKAPFWAKIPIIKELRVAVGWQKGMLITGLLLTAFFLLVALFAPVIAPYGYARSKMPMEFHSRPRQHPHPSIFGVPPQVVMTCSAV